MKPIKYFSLINKETNSEVYTSPAYTLAADVVDYDKVFAVFRYYFDRINSSIKQQLESPRTTEDQKKNLKYITPENYKFSFMELTNSGGYSKKTFWTKDLSDFSDLKNYSYT